MRRSFTVMAAMLVAAGTVAAQEVKTPPHAGDSLPSIVKRKEGAQPPAERKTSNARLELSDSEFNFGYAPQKTKISHVYWIRNAGPDTAHISDVRPGCGCTKAPLKKKVLAPGDSTDVEVIFSTGMYSSQTRKSATIVSDVAGNVPAISFNAYPTPRIDSLAPVTFIPSLVDLDSVTQTGGGRIDVKVRNTSAEPVSLALVSAPHEWFTIQLPVGPIAPGGEETIQVEYTGAIAGEILSKSFTVQVSDTASTRFTVPIQKQKRWGPTPTSSAN